MRFFLYNVFIASFLALVLSSCGWQLRGLDNSAPPKNFALNTHDTYAPFARQLQQTLMRRGVTLSASAPVQLYLGEEIRDKRTVAVTTLGAAAQYELHMRIDYVFNQSGSEPKLPITISSQRVYDFIPGSNLAKLQEEQTLITEMRQELINRILKSIPRDIPSNAAP
ncbi:MAG: LPS assembly lipoprotein LptE [Marinagarivorans sp.]|nr:LPS assembly lipoprotein LptE [Marinagarivorans sp.]